MIRSFIADHPNTLMVADQVHGTIDNTDAYLVMYSVLFGLLPR